MPTTTTHTTHTTHTPTLLALLIAGLALSTAAHAQNILDNYDTPIASREPLSHSLFKAMGWTMGSQSYTLDSVNVRLTISTQSAPVLATLYEGDGSPGWGIGNPLTTLTRAPLPPVGTFDGDHTYTPDNPVILERDKTYWVLLHTFGINHFWSHTNTSSFHSEVGAVMQVPSRRIFSGDPPVPGAFLNHIQVSGTLVDTIVVPRINTSVEAGVGFTQLIHLQPHTYQAVIAASELALIKGNDITGITGRIRSVGSLTTWPAARAAQWANYEIRLSTSNNPPGSLSTTFADNVGPDAVLVRSGPLTIPLHSFPVGAVAPATNDFGHVIEFATPFHYSGGDLLIDIRHTGHNEGTNRLLDSVGTNGGIGYGTLVQAMGRNLDPNATTGFQTMFTVVQLTHGESTFCYANCDGSTIVPVLNVDDFTCFINEFASATSLPHAEQITHYANCDGSTIAPVLNVDDFTCFINEFAQGCP